MLPVVAHRQPVPETAAPYGVCLPVVAHLDGGVRSAVSIVEELGALFSVAHEDVGLRGVAPRAGPDRAVSVCVVSIRALVAAGLVMLPHVAPGVPSTRIVVAAGRYRAVGESDYIGAGVGVAVPGALLQDVPAAPLAPLALAQDGDIVLLEPDGEVEALPTIGAEPAATATAVVIAVPPRVSSRSRTGGAVVLEDGHLCGRRSRRAGRSWRRYARWCRP